MHELRAGMYSCRAQLTVLPSDQEGLTRRRCCCVCMTFSWHLTCSCWTRGEDARIIIWRKYGDDSWRCSWSVFVSRQTVIILCCSLIRSVSLSSFFNAVMPTYADVECLNAGIFQTPISSVELHTLVHRMSQFWSGSCSPFSACCPFHQLA